MNTLITNTLREELIANDERAQQGMSRLDMVPIVRLFTPDANATWVIVSGEERGDDVFLYGWCDLGLGSPEFGYASLKELQAIRGTLGLPVERDVQFSTKLSLADYVDDNLRITETQFFG